MNAKQRRRLTRKYQPQIDLARAVGRFTGKTDLPYPRITKHFAHPAYCEFNNALHCSRSKPTRVFDAEEAQGS